MKEGKGRGYVGKSMSVNARACHDSGIMPMSSWRKVDFVDEVYYELGKQIKKYKGSFKDYLVLDSWHHTGALYNVTNFYKVDFAKVEEAIENGDIVCYTNEEIAQAEKAEAEQEAKKQEMYDRLEKEKAAEEAAIKREIANAEKVTRTSKKGTLMTTIIISENEKILHDKMTRRQHIPLKQYTSDIKIEGIAELKLK